MLDALDDGIELVTDALEDGCELDALDDGIEPKTKILKDG